MTSAKDQIDPFLVAHLLNTTAHPGTRTPMSRCPLVHLSPADAQRLGLTKSESVFVVGNNGVILVPFQLSANFTGGSPQDTRRSSGSSKKFALSAGSAQVSPSSLATLLCIDSSSERGDVGQLHVESPSVAFPSTPAKGFTFQGQVNTPSPVPATPSSFTREKSEVTLFGSASSLGKTLFTSLCRTCSSLVLECSDTIPKKDHRYVERLFLAYYTELFVQQGQELSISFTGKPLMLRVVQTEADVDLSLLKLDDDPNEAALSNLPCFGVLKHHQGSLLRITKDTTVKIRRQGDKDETKRDDQRRLVAGLDQVVQEVTALLETPILRSESLRKHGLSVPRGVLLYGASGVGKTALARQVVQSIDCPTEYVPCSQIISQASIVGQAERYLARLFEGKSQKILILDDVHLICSRRGGHSTNDRLTATLLALMDGVLQTQVVVLAITTDPSLLDPALRRSGRLDTEIEVPIPDSVEKRAAILHFHGAQCSEDHVRWEYLAQLAKGFNGSDCMLAVKFASRLAHDGGSVAIQHTHLEQAVRATKPSAIKSISVEVPKVYWSSIGGMNSVKQELREAIDLAGADFQSVDLPPTRGILLYGPPGCSKTLMARALATEGSMNFLAVKGPELLSKWLGESERALASLFRRARAASPAIIFFDEIDAIASHRGASDSPSTTRLLSQLLTEMDGVKLSPRRVVVVAATNRPDLLDNALVRFGRIDRKIYVGLPDEQSRSQIFKLQLEGKSVSVDIDFDALAHESDGCTGAEVVAICREAALYAAEAGSSQQITMKHAELALANTQRQVTREMLDFYEACHGG